MGAYINITESDLRLTRFQDQAIIDAAMRSAIKLDAIDTLRQMMSI